MNPENQLELHIPSIPGYEKLAMDFAASVAKMVGFGDERIEDLKTAVSEACINAIEHGHHFDAATKVGIRLTIEGSKLEVVVQDQGEGLTQENTLPHIEDKMEGKTSTRGWGTFLIKSLMDEVEFESRPEGGNVVKMVIHLDK